MKKGILPFRLFLIIIALGGLGVALLSFSSGPDSDKSNLQKQHKKTEVGYSLEHLKRIRNNQKTGLIAPADLKRVKEGLEKMPSNRETTLNWTQLGPDNFGGRTRAIHFDNQGSDPPIAYAGSVSGGLWKSTNLGTTWTKINMDSYNLNVSSIVQTGNGDLFVGTGETFEANEYTGLGQMGYSSGFMGQGIFKSTDGDNFKVLPSTVPDFNNIESDWAFVNELAVDPTNNRIYAATNTGLKYSNDEGQTWKTAKDIEGNELIMNALDVQAGSDGWVIACVDNHCYVSPSGSVDGFINRSTGDSISLPETAVTRIEFAIAPSDPNIVYASVVDFQGKVYNIYRSDDKGGEWRIILPGTPSVPIFSDPFTTTGQGQFANAITVYPDDPDKLIIGGYDAWQGQKVADEGYFDWYTISESFSFPLVPTYLPEHHHVYTFVPGMNNQFLVGTDGGVSIGTISGGEYEYSISNRNYYTTQFYTVANSGIKDYVMGGTQSNGTLMLQGDGNTGEEGVEVLSGVGGPCAISTIAPNVIVVSSESGVFRRSDDFGVNYSSPDQFPGSIGNPAAFQTPMVLVENFNNQNSGDSIWYHADEFIAGGTTITVRSSNAGQPFSYKVPDGTDLNPGDSIQVKDVVTSYYYLGVASGIFFTKDILHFDKEVEWFEISNSDYGVEGTPYSMAMSGDGNHLFVGTLNGKLYRISNLATAYNYDRADVNSPTSIVSTQVIKLLVPGTEEEVSQVITSIAVDPKDPNNVMLTLGNYGNDHNILYCENALDQYPEFKSRQGNLPPMPVYSSVIEMSNTDIAFVGTEHGVYSTENIHSTNPQWKKQFDGMGSVPVFEMKQQLISQPSKSVKLVNGNEVIYVTYPGTNNWGSIYAATLGRGLFMADNYFLVGMDENHDISNPTENELFIYPNPVSNNMTVEFNANSNSEATISIYDLGGKLISNQKISVQKGANTLRNNLSGLPAGTYILKAKVGNRNLTSKFLVN